MNSELNTLIVEDEKHARDALTDILEMVCPEVTVVGTADSVESAISLITLSQPDLVFLDIQLGRQLSFEILDKLPKGDYQIVFVTAYNDFAEEAFRFSAVDYLLKPINPERLRVAVDRVLNRMNENDMTKMLEVLSQNLRSKGQNPKKIVLNTLEMMHVVDVEDILMCQSSVNYTVFHLKDGKELLISKTLKEFDVQLSPYGFFRLHRSWLINMDYVSGYDRREGGCVIMNSGAKIPISPQKKDELMRLLK